MGKENQAIPRKAALGIFGIIGSALFYELYVRPKLPHFSRVLDAVNGNPVSCFIENISELKSFPFDAIAVPGGGIKKNEFGLATPNEFQKIRLEAAAIKYIQKQAPIIILLDGKLEDSGDSLISKQYLQNKVKKLSQGTILLPDESVIIENISVNTATNMKQLRKLVDLHHLQQVLLITNNFHADRAEIHACAFGINALSLPAENIIIDQFPERQSELDLFYQGQPIDKIKEKEFLGIAVSFFDPNGALSTRIKEFTLNH